MSLLGCPNEVLWQIAKYLDELTLSYLIQTSRFFSQLLTLRLHQLAIQDKDGLPALCWAAVHDHAPLARLLLSKGSDVNGCEPKLQETPLHHAALNGSKNIVILLLNSGAGVNKRNTLKRTPLHHAAAGGYEKLVRLLLVSGADIHAKDNTLNTPFRLAVESVPTVLAQLMLMRGPADPNELWRAAEYRAKATVEALLENGSAAEIDMRDNNGETPLHWAAASGFEDIGRYEDMGIMVFKLLIKKGVNIHAVDNEHNTLLHIAASNGCAAIVRFLLENFMDVNSRNIYGQTPLLCAAQGDVDCPVRTIKLLLDYRAQVNARDFLGTTALHNLVFGCSAHLSLRALEGVAMLLNKGADTNIQDLGGETALHIAVFGMNSDGSKEVIELLLDGGADIDIKDFSGISPVHLAQLAGNDDITGLLLDYKASKVVKEVWYDCEG